MAAAADDVLFIALAISVRRSIDYMLVYTYLLKVGCAPLAKSNNSMLNVYPAIKADGFFHL